MDIAGKTEPEKKKEPAEKGAIRKAWDWANKGLISGDTLLNLVGNLSGPKPPDMKPGETTAQYLKRNESTISPDHPYLAAIRSGLAGAVTDTYDTASGFTSPAGLALLAAGALSKALPAASKLQPAIKALLLGSGGVYLTEGSKQLGTGAGKLQAEGASLINPLTWSPESSREMLQGGATAFMGGYGVGEGGAGLAREGAAKVGPALRRTGQSILDLGPELTEKAVKDVSAKHAEKTATAEAKQAAENEKTALANREKIEEHADKVREVARKNEEQNAEHALAKAEVDERNAAATEKQTRRGELARNLKEGSAKLGQGIKQLDAQVRAEANAKYNTVRNKVANDIGTEASPVADAVRYARKNLIRGSEESIKQFTSILKREPSEEAMAALDAARNSSDPAAREFAKKYDELSGIEEAADEGKPLKFEDWKGYSTELGEKLAKGNLPDDVYRALKYVKEKVDLQKQIIADRNNAGAELADADNFFRRYMETFYDKPSAVAATLDAVGKFDPDYYASPFVRGKSAKIGIAALQKYSPELANLAQSLRGMDEEFKSLPKTAKLENYPEPPKPVEAPPKPKLEEPKQVPKPKAPTVDPQELKRKQLGRMAESLRGFRRYDAFILMNSVVWSFLGGGWKALLAEPAVLAGKVAIGKALSRPAVIEWLTKPQPEDLAALQKLPKDAQSEFKSNMKNFIGEEVAHGRKVDVAPEVKKFLGPTASALVQRGKEIIKGDEGTMTMPRPRANETNGKTAVENPLDRPAGGRGGFKTNPTPEEMSRKPSAIPSPEYEYKPEGVKQDLGERTRAEKPPLSREKRARVRTAEEEKDTAAWVRARDAGDEAEMERIERKFARKGETEELPPNASGESKASMEAITRVANEQRAGVKRFRIDTRSGTETPLYGVDAVEVTAGPYDVIIKRFPDGTEEIVDQGAKARRR